MRVRRHAVWTVALSFALLLSACEVARQQGEAPAPPTQLQGKGKIHFVPIGEFPSPTRERLVAFFKEKLHLSIETLPIVPIERTAFDDRRRQLIAEELIGLMQRRYPELSNDPEALLIGITIGDMYIRSRPEWRYAFAAGDTVKVAVVSSARMDPTFYREPTNPQVLHVRLRKMVAKYIGYMYFRRSQSNDRKSVMYGPILGVDDLDAIGDDF